MSMTCKFHYLVLLASYTELHIEMNRLFRRPLRSRLCSTSAVTCKSVLIHSVHLCLMPMAVTANRLCHQTNKEVAH